MGQQKPLWTTCFIARNEESVIARALDSLKEFRERGGVCVVIDTGSSDKTVEISRSYGCIVEEVGDKFITVVDEKMAKEVNERFIVDNEPPLLKEGDRIFDFASARNYAATFSPTDMVSWCDCDEVFTRLNIDEINKKILEGFTQFEYNFIFAHDPYGKPSIQFVQSKMYDRTKFQWRGRIHETISPIT